MANPDRPNGFAFAKSLIGAPVQGLLREYPAADRSADATANHGDIYVGDPVTLVNGEVLVANSGDTVLGVAVGAGSTVGVQFGRGGMFNPQKLEQRQLAYTDTGNVWVCPARDTLFEIQTEDVLPLVLGQEADHNVTAGTAHGSVLTGISNAELVAAANLDVTVVEIKVSPDNDTALANSRYFVRFNNIVDAY